MLKIIDYKAGNAPSVLHAVGHLGFEAEFARNPDELGNASKIILPGVGSAGATMAALREAGLIKALGDAVLKKNIPFLGICVGMQILFEHSEEENADCLGWLKGRVVKFARSKVRVPQMGWNKVSLTETPINKTLEDYFYFVNSYYVTPKNESDIWGVSDYNGAFTAAVRKGNIYGTQFHIEKSGEAGLWLLRGFLLTD
ncbi:MAG: imidazole glycerol phosphate synthase subunit HisH [Oscillospiraceae bacterium]|nr:imidazole glycerol phosphate synthase subunit HisH [Oscillospiraceae bacterium]